MPKILLAVASAAALFALAACDGGGSGPPEGSTAPEQTSPAPEQPSQPAQ